MENGHMKKSVCEQAGKSNGPDQNKAVKAPQTSGSNQTIGVPADAKGKRPRVVQ